MIAQVDDFSLHTGSPNEPQSGADWDETQIGDAHFAALAAQIGHSNTYRKGLVHPSDSVLTAWHQYTILQKFLRLSIHFPTVEL